MKVEGTKLYLSFLKYQGFIIEIKAAHLILSLLSLSGHVFPEFKESDAMFAAERVSHPSRNYHELTVCDVQIYINVFCFFTGS